VFPLAVAAVLILGVVGTVGFVRSRNYIPKDGGASQTVGGAAGDGSGMEDNGTPADGSGTGSNGTLADGSDRESSDSASVPMQQVGSGKTQTTVSQTISQGQGKADNRDERKNLRQPGGSEVADGVQGAGEEDVSGSDSRDIYGPLPEGEWHPKVFKAGATVSTAEFSSEIISEYGVLIDVENKTIVAQRAGKIRMYPASMTKILTVLTAADALGILGPEGENSPVLDEKFTITIEITDYSFVNDCSNVGFEVGEEVTVRDLFYGTILPSGADAALGLAYYVSGSQEAFVELMNQELEKLNLLGTSHFTNCVGIYDDEHYSTAYDIAVILKKTLLPKTGRQPARMVYHPVTGILPVIFRHTQNPAHKPGIFFLADQFRNLPVRGNLSLRYLFHHRKYFINQFFRQDSRHSIPPV